MLVGLPTVAIAAISAEILGNSRTRPASRLMFVGVILWASGAPQAVAGVGTYLASFLP